MPVTGSGAATSEYANTSTCRRSCSRNSGSMKRATECILAKLSRKQQHTSMCMLFKRNQDVWPCNARHDRAGLHTLSDQCANLFKIRSEIGRQWEELHWESSIEILHIFNTKIDDSR